MEAIADESDCGKWGEEGVWFSSFPPFNPLGTAILTLALSASCSGMRTTSHLRKPGTSPTSMTLTTLVFLRCYCILNAQSAKQ